VDAAQRDERPGEAELQRRDAVSQVQREAQHVEQHRQLEQVAEVVGRGDVLELRRRFAAGRHRLRVNAPGAHLADADHEHADGDGERQGGHRDDGPEDGYAIGHGRLPSGRVRGR